MSAQGTEGTGEDADQQASTEIPAIAPQDKEKRRTLLKVEREALEAATARDSAAAAASADEVEHRKRSASTARLGLLTTTALSIATCLIALNANATASRADEAAQKRLRDDAKVRCAESLSDYMTPTIAIALALDKSQAADASTVTQLLVATGKVAAICTSANLVDSSVEGELDKALDRTFASVSASWEEQAGAFRELTAALGDYVTLDISGMWKVLETSTTLGTQP